MQKKLEKENKARSNRINGYILVYFYISSAAFKETLFILKKAKYNFNLYTIQSLPY